MKGDSKKKVARKRFNSYKVKKAKKVESPVAFYRSRWFIWLVVLFVYTYVLFISDIGYFISQYISAPVYMFLFLIGYFIITICALIWRGLPFSVYGLMIGLFVSSGLSAFFILFYIIPSPESYDPSVGFITWGLFLAEVMFVAFTSFVGLVIGGFVQFFRKN